MKFNTTLMKRSVSAAAIVICAFVIFFELFESPVRVADFTPNQTPTQDQRLRPAADRMLFQEEDGSIEPTCIRGTIMIDDSTPMPRGTVCIYPNFIIEGMKPGSLLAKGTIQASGTYVVQNIPGARIPTDAEVQIVVTTKTDAQFEKTFRQVNKRISRKQSEFVEKNAITWRPPAG